MAFRYNNYTALYLGPDGTAYVGVLAGIVAIRDGGARQVQLPMIAKGSHG